VPQRREYVTRNAMCARMQGKSTIEEHAVKEDDTDIDEILRKLAASRAKKKKLVLMYNIIILIIYNKKKSHMHVNIQVLHTFFFSFPFNEFLINLLFRDIF
jgi:hypothetical protein